MGRHKMFTVEELLRKWEEYKEKCDNNTIKAGIESDIELTDADGKTIVTKKKESQKVKSPITYTIEGFCVFLRISRKNFYATYCKSEDEIITEEDCQYGDIVEMMREEGEVDTRAKFETGQINSRLAPLWMSKYGYSQKAENTVDVKENNLLSAIVNSTKQDIDTDDISELQ